MSPARGGEAREQHAAGAPVAALAAGSPVAAAPGAAAAPSVGAAPSMAPPPPAWRLVGSLALAGALAGLLLVTVYELTRPSILAYRRAQLLAAVQGVLHEPARVEELLLVDGGLRPLPTGAGAAGGAAQAEGERVYAGYDEQGRRLGFAIAAERPGYQDVVALLFGYDPERDRLLGMTVLQSRETPGLGDRIEKDPAFTGQFDGLVPPLLGVKAGAPGDEHAVDMITGATISSRTVIAAINAALERVGPALRAAPPGSVDGAPEGTR